MSAALAAGLAASAQASPVDGLPVNTGHTIAVFHEVDFVGAFGYALGRPLKLEVFRGEHNIAHVSAPAASTDEGGGLEVNHGVEGVPAVAGDCWEQLTADIQPYDRIEVTDSRGIKEAILVDDVRVTDGPADDTPTSVTLTGHARSAATGEPIPIASLEGEMRNTSRFRATPVIAAGDPAVAGSFRATYSAAQSPQYGVTRNDDGAPPRAALLGPAAEHAIGFGHAPLPNGLPAPEMQMADAGGAPGPAAGCEAAPAAGTNAATSLDDAMVTRQSGDLVVTGTAAFDAERVDVTIADGAGGSVTAGTAGFEAAPGAAAEAARAWSVAVPADELATLAADAELTVSSVFAGGGDAGPAAHPLRIRRDIVAPAAPTATPAPGDLGEGADVALRAEPGATIHFTTDGSEPTTASDAYGLRLRVSADTTVKAIAVDAAGNVSPVASLRYTARAPAARGPAPRIDGRGAAAVPALSAAIPALAGSPASALRVAGVSVRSTRLSLRTARRAGVLGRFVVPAGAEYVEARLVRLGPGGAGRVLARRLMAAVPGRRTLARFTGAAVRRRLAPGRYALEVRAGEDAGRLGAATTTALRITR